MRISRMSLFLFALLTDCSEELSSDPQNTRASNGDSVLQDLYEFIADVKKEVITHHKERVVKGIMSIDDCKYATEEAVYMVLDKKGDKIKAIIDKNVKSQEQRKRVREELDKEVWILNKELLKKFKTEFLIYMMQGTWYANSVGEQIHVEDRNYTTRRKGQTFHGIIHDLYDNILYGDTGYVCSKSDITPSLISWHHEQHGEVLWKRYRTIEFQNDHVIQLKTQNKSASDKTLKRKKYKKSKKPLLLLHSNTFYATKKIRQQTAVEKIETTMTSASSSKMKNVFQNLNENKKIMEKKENLLKVLNPEKQHQFTPDIKDERNIIEKSESKNLIKSNCSLKKNKICLKSWLEFMNDHIITQHIKKKSFDNLIKALKQIKEIRKYEKKKTTDKNKNKRMNKFSERIENINHDLDEQKTDTIELKITEKENVGVHEPDAEFQTEDSLDKLERQEESAVNAIQPLEKIIDENNVQLEPLVDDWFKNNVSITLISENNKKKLRRKFLDKLKEKLSGLSSTSNGFKKSLGAAIVAVGASFLIPAVKKIFQKNRNDKSGRRSQASSFRNDTAEEKKGNGGHATNAETNPLAPTDPANKEDPRIPADNETSNQKNEETPQLKKIEPQRANNGIESWVVGIIIGSSSLFLFATGCYVYAKFYTGIVQELQNEPEIDENESPNEMPAVNRDMSTKLDASRSVSASIHECLNYASNLANRAILNIEEMKEYLKDDDFGQLLLEGLDDLDTIFEDKMGELDDLNFEEGLKITESLRRETVKTIGNLENYIMAPDKCIEDLTVKAA